MFSGVFYGYNSLIPIYKDAGVFSQFCENTQHNDTITCHMQETNFGRAFATWLIAQAIGSFVLGIILDRFGIIIMKIIASICVLGGFICLGFTPTINWLLYIGGSLLTMSAYCIEISNVTISGMFSGHGNLIVALYSALFDASSIVMSLIKYLTDFGAPFSIVCSIYGSIGCVFILGSIIFLKSRTDNLMSDNNDEDNEVQVELNEDNISSENNQTNDCNSSSIYAITETYTNAVDENFPTLKQCFISFEYLIQMAYFVILSFRFTFFLSQMSSQLIYLFPTQSDVIEHLLSVSNIFFLGSLFISPIFGVLLDRYQRYTFRNLNKDPNVSPKDIYNKINACFFVPSCICSCAMILGSSLLFVSNKYLFYLVFVCMTITRALLFAINGAYIFSALPKKYFGTLVGTVYLVTGLINLLQQLIIPFASPDSHPDLVNYIMIGMCVLTLVHGFYLKFKK